jgi:Domain of unknown function (DUF1707)
MSTWQNPLHPGFSVDPSVAPTLPPSTSDRDYADSTLRAAHADGRLTDAEFAERVERADSAWTLRELSEVIADLSAPTASSLMGPNLTMPPVASLLPIVAELDPARRSAQLVLSRSVVSWLALTMLFNLIWLFSSGPASYYWPIWPMLGTAVPLIGLVVARFGPDPVPTRRPVEPPADLR